MQQRARSREQDQELERLVESAVVSLRTETQTTDVAFEVELGKRISNLI